MAITRESLIDDIDTQYSQAFTKSTAAWNSAQEAYAHYQLNQDHEAIYDLYSSCLRLVEMGKKIMAKNDPIGVNYAVPYFLRNFTTETSGETFTMGILLAEMFQANNGELKNFIGLNDAYRQSLWNKPFNEEFWAAIARGFEQWE